MKKVIACMICLCLLAACGQRSSDSERLQAENDSLKLENAKNTTQMDEMLSLLNEIEADFQTIRDAENYLTIHQNDIELKESTRDQIRRNMQLVQETLRKNKDRITELEKKLAGSDKKSATLQATVNRLTTELEQRAAVIATLQTELAKRDSQIREMGEQMSGLNEEIENLALTNMSQSDQLKQQDQQLNIGYYCFGTSRELKDQKIIDSGGLLGKTKVLPDGFNRDYFISVDIRELREIPLFARKAKLLTSHPDNSYELVADEDKNLTLFIVDYQQFWSVGKYLVIEVGL
ncbi:MAG: hypothetical protein LUG98_03255 [Tannerellaceae bacterium]|nr:hypothetical protein [Tannerellaceae bacterium]